VKPSLVQCQVRAIFIGLLWAIPYLAILLHLTGMVYPFPLLWLAWLLGFPILIAFFVAVLTGPFDKLAIVSLLIPAIYDFVISTHEDWHLAGTLLGPSLPLSVLTVTVMLGLAVAGIALKRRLVPTRGVTLNAREQRSLARCFWWDVGIVMVLGAVVLGIDAFKIARERDPGVFVATREEILNAATATEADKLQVVMKLYRYRSPGDVEVLREALKDSSPKVRLTAAALLLQEGNSVGLSEMEQQLMLSSHFTVTNDNQVIHSDWLGFGEGGPTFLTFDLAPYLACVTGTNAAPILTRLSSSADPDTRNAAALALNNIRLGTTPMRLHWMH
jgi:hypothetical protein